MERKAIINPEWLALEGKPHGKLLCAQQDAYDVIQYDGYGQVPEKPKRKPNIQCPNCVENPASAKHRRKIVYIIRGKTIIGEFDFCSDECATQYQMSLEG